MKDCWPVFLIAINAGQIWEGRGACQAKQATDDWKERKSIRERWEDSSRGNNYLGVFLAIQEIWWLLANEMGWLFRSCVADIH